MPVDNSIYFLFFSNSARFTKAVERYWSKLRPLDVASLQVIVYHQKHLVVGTVCRKKRPVWIIDGYVVTTVISFL